MRISANAKSVLKARYLRRDAGGRTIETPEQMFRRVADVAASAEAGYGIGPPGVRAVSERFYSMMAEGAFLPNSPMLMNAGRANGMLSACFVVAVEDSIESIFTALHQSAMVQKAGGGTGFSFSRLRPMGAPVASTGGTTSGPVSFMRVFAEATNAIQQGAFRRGANMGVMRIDHPDVIHFIDAKRQLDELTNFNLSVAVTDAFMETLLASPGSDHTVTDPHTGRTSTLAKNGGCWSVGALFDLIVLRAWETGEPGIVFIDVMNKANPTPHRGLFEATNPCGEQPLLPCESCNLGSINLLRFVRGDDGRRLLDMAGLSACVRTATRFLDNAIDAARFPLPEFDAGARGNRKVGLGVMGFADTLFALKIPYDSEEAVSLGSEIMRTLNDESHQASMELAQERGTFPNWEESTWAERGIRIRNACTTCVAPTGTISVIAGCSGGIEPVFAPVFSRNVLEGKTLLEVNPVFEETARREGFLSEGLLRDVAAAGSFRGLEQVPEQWRRIFVSAHDIEPEWHVRMQAAFQQHCDASISKTINMRKNATPQDVRKALLLAYRLGCKGVTVYRDGCRHDQPMSIDRHVMSVDQAMRPADLPPIMPAIRIKQPTPFGNMHIKIVVDPALGREREVFAQLGKGGDLANSDIEAICRMVSLYLRVNGALEDVISQLEDIGSSFSIPTSEGRISSLADGLARGLDKYRAARRAIGLESLLLGKPPEASQKTEHAPGKGRSVAHRDSTQGFLFKCSCGSDLVFTEGCVKCLACGYAEC